MLRHGVHFLNAAFISSLAAQENESPAPYVSAASETAERHLRGQGGVPWPVAGRPPLGRRLYMAAKAPWPANTRGYRHFEPMREARSVDVGASGEQARRAALEDRLGYQARLTSSRALAIPQWLPKKEAAWCVQVHLANRDRLSRPTVLPGPNRWSTIHLSSYKPARQLNESLRILTIAIV